MFGFYPGGNKLRPMASHLRQQFLTLLIDEGDLTQVHNRVIVSGSAAARVPALAQLSYPRAGELAAQRPPVSGFCLTVYDPQHGDCFLAFEKGMRCANYC
jgi:hypothetical protein